MKRSRKNKLIIYAPIQYIFIRTILKNNMKMKENLETYGNRKKLNMASAALETSI